MTARRSHPEMIVCAVERNKESHENVERRTDFSLRERKLEMAG